MTVVLLWCVLELCALLVKHVLHARNTELTERLQQLEQENLQLSQALEAVRI